MRELFISWAVPSLCGALAGLLSGGFARRRQQRETMARGMQCLLRLEIIRSYETYSHKGYCPVYAREALSRGYRAYHALGGNDVATDLYDRLMELPTE